MQCPTYFQLFSNSYLVIWKEETRASLKDKGEKVLLASLMAGEDGALYISCTHGVLPSFKLFSGPELFENP